MGAPFKELDDKAIRDSKHIPETVRLYIGHHIRNDLSGLQFIAQKLEDYGEKHNSVEIIGLCQKLEGTIKSIALDLMRIGI